VVLCSVLGEDVPETYCAIHLKSTRRGSGVRLRWTHVDGVRGVKPRVDVHIEHLKLESTDVILSSAHAKNLVHFYQNFSLDGIKSRNFRRYKLVI